MSSIPAMMRSLSSCFDPTLMWRRTERANMEKKPSMKVEPGAVLGCEGELETAGRSSGQPSFGFSRGVRGMIVENQFDGGAARISGVNKFEEFDELSTAVAVSVQAVDLPRQQINPGQQADRAGRRQNPEACGLPRRRPSALVCALRFAGGGFIGAGAQAHLRCRNGAGSTWTDTISSVKRPALGVECTVRSFGTLEALRSFSYLSCHSKVISLTFYDQRVPSWSELKLGVLGTQQ